MSEPRSARRLFGTALMAVGGLMAALSGLCTLGYAGVGLVAAIQGGDDGYGIVILIVALAAGLVPILFGVGLYFGGKALRKPRPDV
ncbi:hypothetical protein [Phenylobacterium sp.]|uniref:hypothetical protein n=1 Tax=Phenylobacterium sp. TaxID=1871053 RepID=UPI003BAB0010